MTNRNFHGYGNSPPAVVWPNNSRIAISVVVNYEEGSEYSILDGDEAHESNNEVPSPVPPSQRDLANESFEYKDIKNIYEEGYKNKSNRTNLFPWNKNVDCLLNMEASEAMNFLDKHFYNYQGKYIMYIKKD